MNERAYDEDELTPEERREALALFKRGRWVGGIKPQVEQDSARWRAAEEGLPVTVRERRAPSPRQPTLTAGEAIVGVGLAAGAFFLGRWWARHRKATKVHVGKTNAYVTGALALAR